MRKEKVEEVKRRKGRTETECMYFTIFCKVSLRFPILGTEVLMGQKINKHTPRDIQ